MYLYLPRVDDWQRLEEITARDWILRYMGQEIYDKFWGPLLRGKFGDLADQVSMTWLWGKIKVRGSSRQGATAKEMLAYPLGSFEIITQALVDRLQAGGADLRLNQEVIGLTTDPDDPQRVTGVVTKKETLPFDVVIATVPGYNLLEIAPPSLDEAYADLLRSVRYQAARGAAAGQQAEPEPHLLDEHRRPDHALCGRHRAHQLCAAQRVPGPAPDLRLQLPGAG